MMAEVEEAVSAPTVELDEKPKLDNLGRAYSTGKRKDAVARVWIKKGSGKITVNKKPLEKYFARPTLQMIIHNHENLNISWKYLLNLCLKIILNNYLRKNL